MNIPTNLKYSETDEWVLIEGKSATVGVTDFAQDQLSDIVFAEITVEVGESVSKGQTIATIESVKAAADVSLPVAGKVSAVNESLAANPEVINSDPFGKAWMIKVELSSNFDLSGLMDSAAYTKHCESRGH
jgi:glycine cleavage system H protein